MRTIAATSALYQTEVIGIVDSLGYVYCNDCAVDLGRLGTPATPSTFEIDDCCEACTRPIISIACGHWRETTVRTVQHPTLPNSDQIVRRCETCGTERTLTSSRHRGRAARSGRGYYYLGGSDPDMLR